MQLIQLEINQFRGINQLMLNCHDCMVLIGENQWGKRSLYDALTLFLSPRKQLYQLEAPDFHYNDNAQQMRSLRLQFVFLLTTTTVDDVKNLPIWYSNASSDKICRYVIDGQLEGKSALTTHQFVDENDHPLPLSPEQISSALVTIKQYYPVIYLHDLKNGIAAVTEKSASGIKPEQFRERLENAITHSVVLADSLNNARLRYYVDSIQHILERYFVFFERHNPRNSPLSDQEEWEIVSQFNRMISEHHEEDIRLILLEFFISILWSQHNETLGRNARPILLIEDMGGRFHPIMMSTVWSLLSQLPVQKITVTNSSEMVSMVPLDNLVRLIRRHDCVTAYQQTHMNSVDTRKLAFHIRFNRSSALFARGWILVEGETEVWLLTEMARQFGYQLDTEGIKVIEFAQCGLRPLIRFAQDMGIEWHVLTDGDDAGQKYADTTRNYAQKNHEDPALRLTQLPNTDIEHYLYKHGFSAVYQRISHLPEDELFSMRRVISQAINRSSKPDLAIEIVEEMKRRGFSSVPHLLQTLFSTIIRLIERKNTGN